MGDTFRLVYSTGQTHLCRTCGRPADRCLCQRPAAPPGDGVVRVGRQTKGCKGSGMTIITGLPLSEEALVGLARKLKQKCGAGGTIKNGVIEIQGEHRDLLVAELQQLGYRVKRSGG